jgi:hypothetical protein
MQQSGRSAVPSKQRRDVFTATFEVLRSQGLFIPNTCGYGHPRPDDVGREPGLNCRHITWPPTLSLSIRIIPGTNE